MHYLYISYQNVMGKGIKIVHHSEHLAVAAYSTAEVFELHWLLWYVSAALIGVALSAFIYEIWKDLGE